MQQMYERTKRTMNFTFACSLRGFSCCYIKEPIIAAEPRSRNPSLKDMRYIGAIPIVASPREYIYYNNTVNLTKTSHATRVPQGLPLIAMCVSMRATLTHPKRHTLLCPCSHKSRHSEYAAALDRFAILLHIAWIRRYAGLGSGRGPSAVGSFGSLGSVTTWLSILLSVSVTSSGIHRERWRQW